MPRVPTCAVVSARTPRRAQPTNALSRLPARSPSADSCSDGWPSFRAEQAARPRDRCSAACRNDDAPFDQDMRACDSFRRTQGEPTMKYLCLVYLDEKRLEEVDDNECRACGDGLRRSGHMLG